jgi:hypothetical protein
MDEMVDERVGDLREGGGCGLPLRCVGGGLSNGTEAKHLRTTPTRTAQRSRRTFRMRLKPQIDGRLCNESSLEYDWEDQNGIKSTAHPPLSAYAIAPQLMTSIYTTRDDKATLSHASGLQLH